MGVRGGFLLLDVDGPLNPYAARPHRRPSGYRTYRRTPGGGWVTGRDAQRHAGMRVWLNPSHGPALLALARDTGLQLAWCTTWLDEANARIGPAIGLPPLPVVEFPSTDLEVGAGGVRWWTSDGAWKWTAAARFADGRPLAWLDDEHDDRGHLAARMAFDSARGDLATLLCHCDPSTGLLAEHLERVRTWAASAS